MLFLKRDEKIHYIWGNIDKLELKILYCKKLVILKATFLKGDEQVHCVYIWGNIAKLELKKSYCKKLVIL